MLFTPTRLPGATIIDLEPRADERGFFARTYCREEFVVAGLEALAEQCNVSYNHLAGTVRGMHYRLPPVREAKLVRCVRGAILDVGIDLRPESSTYLNHVAVELTAENRRALYVPAMFAHGFQTLTDGAEVSYQMSEAYTAGGDCGLRHDDPALGLFWPLPVSVISPQDTAWPLLTEHQGGRRPCEQVG